MRLLPRHRRGPGVPVPVERRAAKQGPGRAALPPAGAGPKREAEGPPGRAGSVCRTGRFTSPRSFPRRRGAGRVRLPGGRTGDGTGRDRELPGHPRHPPPRGAKAASPPAGPWRSGNAERRGKKREKKNITKQTKQRKTPRKRPKASHTKTANQSANLTPTPTKKAPPPTYRGQIRFTFRGRGDAVTLPSGRLGSPQRSPVPSGSRSLCHLE